MISDSDASAPTTGKIKDLELKVTFFPPLHAERCAWILDNLRRERVTSVLDIGCGGGNLLRCLCNPSPFLGSLGGPASSDDIKQPSQSQAPAPQGPPDLHIAWLAGLDISIADIEASVQATAPPTDANQLPRWEPLEVQLWHGSLDVYNETFVGVECIVATEVIEHLPPSVLPSFAPTLLGRYRPRLLLLTTPNYAFNARFTPPGIADTGGYADPTRRTGRVFRHHDHKFEWTPAEFAAWCAEAASAWGYAVAVDSIGLPREADPWGRDEELGRATQVALFRRKDDCQGRDSVPTPKDDQINKEGAHKLLETHNHTAHPQACKIQALGEIRDLLIRHMSSYYFDEGYTVWDLWTVGNISIACGGYLDALVRAIESFSELSLWRIPGVAAPEWRVKFSGEKHREAVETRKKEQSWFTKAPEEFWNMPSVQEDGLQGGGEWTDAGWPQTPHEYEPDNKDKNIAASWENTEAWEPELGQQDSWG